MRRRRKKKRAGGLGPRAGGPCPCHSGQSYELCCRPFHKGIDVAPDAVALMRSRYAAYAACLPDYVMETTHADSPHRERDERAWRAGILEFGMSTRFVGLEVLESGQDDTHAWVIFEAHMEAEEGPFVMNEHSTFERIEGRWYYIDALS